MCSVVTGKLATDELEEPTIDTPDQTETILQHQYSSTDSIKEDEECGSSPASVSKNIALNHVYFAVICFFSRLKKHWANTRGELICVRQKITGLAGFKDFLKNFYLYMHKNYYY